MSGVEVGGRGGGGGRSSAVNETETLGKNEGNEERGTGVREAIREMWNQRNRKGEEIKVRPSRIWRGRGGRRTRVKGGGERGPMR